MNINYMLLPFCMTVFLVVTISLLFRKGEEEGEEGREKGRKDGRKEKYNHCMNKCIIATVPQ